MQYLNVFLCVLLALFTIVQYNDPDAILWVLIYGLPTIWAGSPRKYPLGGTVRRFARGWD